METPQRFLDAGGLGDVTSTCWQRQLFGQWDRTEGGSTLTKRLGLSASREWVEHTPDLVFAGKQKLKGCLITLFLHLGTSNCGNHRVGL